MFSRPATLSTRSTVSVSFLWLTAAGQPVGNEEGGKVCTHLNVGYPTPPSIAIAVFVIAGFESLLKSQHDMRVVQYAAFSISS